MRKYRCSHALVFSVMTLASVVHGASQYQIIDLDAPAGTTSCGMAVNNSGQVAGYVTSNTTGKQNGFFYNNGTMSILDSTFFAFDINNAGQIAATYLAYCEQTHQSASHGVILDNGTMKDLGCLGGAYSIAEAINTNGHTVGYSYTESQSMHAFYHDGIRMQDIHRFGGNFSESIAYGINDSGQVVGESTHANSQDAYDRHAFVYQNGQMLDLGTLGGRYSCAKSINNAGQIVGFSYDLNNQLYPFLYENGEMKPIPMYGVFAKDINNGGQVVGDSAGDAYLYEQGIVFNLLSLLGENSGWLRICSAESINDLGWITGYGQTDDSQYHAYLMKPIPEPATLSLLAVGAMLLRRRHSR